MSRMTIWWRWVLANLAGALLGVPLAALGVVILGLPFMMLAGFLLGTKGQGALGLFVLAPIVIAPSVFGAVLGFTQWHFMFRHIAPQVSRLAWVLASAVGWAAVVYALAQPSYARYIGFGNSDVYIGYEGSWDGTETYVSALDQVPAVASVSVLILGAGVLLGCLQGWALRAGILRAAWWLGANVLVLILVVLLMIISMRLIDVTCLPYFDGNLSLAAACNTVEFLSLTRLGVVGILYYTLTFFVPLYSIVTGLAFSRLFDGQASANPPSNFDASLAGRIRKQLGQTPGLTEQNMPGALVFLLNGNDCCIARGRDLIVRCDPSLTGAALRQPHTRPVRAGGRQLQGLVLVQEAGLGSETDLAQWLQFALKYVAGLPAK